MLNLLFTSFDSLKPYWQEMEIASVFGPLEREELSRLKVPSRIEEWISSRVAAKVLIRGVIPELLNAPLSSIQMQKESSGKPYLISEESGMITGGFSLSHSHEKVFTCFCEEVIKLGLDLEYIEPRPDSFAMDYFTVREFDKLSECEDQLKSLMVTLLWSAKEAVLKAASLGLNLDTRRVEIIRVGNLGLENTWQPMEVFCPDLHFESHQLFWHRDADFIQTVCLDSTAIPEFSWMKLEN